MHGDLKNNNIMLDTPQRHVRIIDFSAATVSTDMMVDRGRCTVPWASPEDLQRGEKIRGDLLDVYSFGVVLWNMLMRSISKEWKVRRGYAWRHTNWI